MNGFFDRWMAPVTNALPLPVDAASGALGTPGPSVEPVAPGAKPPRHGLALRQTLHDQSPVLRQWVDDWARLRDALGMAHAWQHTAHADGSHELRIHGVWRLRRAAHRPDLTWEQWDVDQNRWVIIPLGMAAFDGQIRLKTKTTATPSEPFPAEVPRLVLLEALRSQAKQPENFTQHGLRMLAARYLHHHRPMPQGETATALEQDASPWAMASPPVHPEHTSQWSEAKRLLEDSLRPKAGPKNGIGAGVQMYRGLRRVLWQHFVIDRQAMRWAAQLAWPEALSLEGYRKVLAHRETVAALAEQHPRALRWVANGEQLNTPFWRPALHPRMAQASPEAQAWWLTLPGGFTHEWRNQTDWSIQHLWESHRALPWPALPTEVMARAVRYRTRFSSPAPLTQEDPRRWSERLHALHQGWQAWTREHGKALWQRPEFDGHLEAAMTWWGEHPEATTLPDHHPWVRLRQAQTLADLLAQSLQPDAAPVAPFPLGAAPDPDAAPESSRRRLRL